MFNKKIRCPYCNEILESPPKTKKKCPHCNNPVYFKVDPYTKRKHYLNEKDNEQIEKLIFRFRIEEKFKKQFIEYGGLTDQYFNARRKEYEKKAGSTYLPFAFINSIFQELSLEYIKLSDYQTLSSMNWSMAYLFFEHDKDFFRYAYESKKMDLFNIKNQEKQLGIKHKVQILTSGRDCEKCYELEGKKYTIEQALKEMPIPVKDCENGLCMCSYTYSIN